MRAYLQSADKYDFHFSDNFVTVCSTGEPLANFTQALLSKIHAVFIVRKSKVWQVWSCTHSTTSHMRRQLGFLSVKHNDKRKTNRSCKWRRKRKNILCPGRSWDTGKAIYHVNMFFCTDHYFSFSILIGEVAKTMFNVDHIVMRHSLSSHMTLKADIIN